MPSIAITGAGSFIGTHLLARLLPHRDLCLRLLVHRRPIVSLPDGGNISIIQGDLLDRNTLTDLVEPGGIVVHLAFLRNASPEENLAAAANLVEACLRAKVRRLIHCSTAVVSGRVSARCVTENTPRRPLQEYEVTKGRLEEILREKTRGSIETIILRPTAVFGPEGRNLLKLADSLRSGSLLINYLKSCIYQLRRMNLVCVENVVGAIEFFIRADQVMHGETFIVSDDEDPANNYRDIERYLMKRLGRATYPVPPVSLPFPILRAMLRLAGRSNDNPGLVYDGGKILSAGFKKPVTFSEGLARFADWYVAGHHADRSRT